MKLCQSFESAQSMLNKDNKFALENYDEKYEHKAILEVMYKNPDEIKTIIGNEYLSQEDKTKNLLERGMPEQFIPLILDSVEEISESWTDEKINQVLQESMFQISKGEWMEAEKNLIEILKHETKQAIAHFGMGLCADMQGRKNLAAEWFKRAYMLDPISFNQARFLIGLE